jgi:hypothetical protein
VIVDTAKDLCQKLAPEINEKKANALWLSYLSEDNKKEKEELVNQLQLLVVKKLGVDFKDDLILLPPSSKKDAYGKGHIYLGDIHYGRENKNSKKKYPLYINLEELSNHAVITGMSGWGKSEISKTIATGLLKQKIPFLVFDPDRSWRSLLTLPKDKYPEAQEIQIFTFGRDIAPLCWNWLFSPPPGVKFSTWLAIVTSTPLEASEISGPGSGTCIEDKALEAIEKFKSGELKILPNTELIKKLLKEDYNVRGRKMLWAQTVERITKSLTREPVWKNFNSTEPMDLSKMLTRPTIIEIDKETSPKHAVLFKWLITLWIIVYRLRQGEAKEGRLNHVCFFDDFSEMLPQGHEKEIGNNTISILFRELRKFGEGLVAILQEPSILPNYVLANCRIHIHFAVQTKKDIEAVENALFLKPEQKHYVDLLDVGECIVRIKNRVKNCFVKFQKLPITRGIITDKIIRERYNASR